MTDKEFEFQKLLKENDELKHREQNLLEMVDRYQKSLKEVRVALIQERCANICNGVDAQKLFDNIMRTIIKDGFGKGGEVNCHLCSEFKDDVHACEFAERAPMYAKQLSQAKTLLEDLVKGLRFDGVVSVKVIEKAEEFLEEVSE